MTPKEILALLDHPDSREQGLELLFHDIISSIRLAAENLPKNELDEAIVTITDYFTNNYF